MSRCLRGGFVMSGVQNIMTFASRSSNVEDAGFSADQFAVEPEHLDILLVEDEPADVRLIERTLREVQGFSIDLTIANSVDAALQLLSERHFDVALVDFFVDSDCGPELVPELTAQDPICAPILLTGHLTPETHHHAILNGAIASLSKNKLDPWQLEVTMRHAILQRYRACMQLKRAGRARQNPNLQPAIYRHIQTTLESLIASAESFEEGLTSGCEAVAIRSARDMRYLAEDLQNFFSDSLALSRPGQAKGDALADEAPCDLQSVLMDVARLLAPSCKERRQCLEVEFVDTPLGVDVPQCVLRRALTDFLLACMAASIERTTTNVSASCSGDAVAVTIQSQIAAELARTEEAEREFDALTSSAMALLDPFGVQVSWEASECGTKTVYHLRFEKGENSVRGDTKSGHLPKCGCAEKEMEDSKSDFVPVL